MKTKYPFWWIAIVLACPLTFALAGPPDGASGPAMGSPYVDLFHGFGLTPPAGTERSTDRIPAQLVSWQMRDAKTNAVLWTLTAGKIVNKEAPADLDAYAKSLAATLKEKENFEVSASQVHEIAGHQAVDFKGTTEGKVRWWQRQVQIATGQGNFVLLRMTGPADAAESMDATMTAVLATVKIIDPKEALAQREKNLQAGAEFLKTLTPEKLAAAIQSEPQYGLIRNYGQVQGGQVIRQSLTSRDNAKGAEIRCDVLYNAADKGKTRDMTTSAFSSADRTIESWEQAQRDSMDKGTQVGWKISTETVPAKGGSKTSSRTIPPEIRNYYLPRALKETLSQLLDLKKPATYGFAVYSGSAFDVYTITVVGPAKVEIDGKEVQAYQVDIQPAEDGPHVQQYVDKKGRALRSVAPGGWISQTADKETFLKTYPGAAQWLGKD